MQLSKYWPGKPLGPAASPGIYDNDQLDSMLAALARFVVSNSAE